MKGTDITLNMKIYLRRKFHPYSKRRKQVCCLLLIIAGVFMWYNPPHTDLFSMMQWPTRLSKVVAPNMNMETAESWAPCTAFSQIAVPTSVATSWDIILAGSDEYAQVLTHTLVAAHHNVLVVAEKSALPTFEDIMTKENIGRFHLMDMSTPLRVSLLRFTQEKQIHALHIALSSKDFLPLFGVTRTAQAVHCLIDLLESITTTPKTKLFLHSEQPTCMFREELSRNNIGDAPTHVENITITVNDTCSCSFDYKEYHDVFLKTIYIYTYTFQMLYDLDNVRIVHYLS